MKKLLLSVVLGAAVIAVIFLFVVNKNTATSKDLVIYAYDSFTSEWGPGPQLITQFQEKYGIKVEMVSFGDAGSVLTKAISEKSDPKADIIIGIDNNLIAKAINEDILVEYKNKKFIPFDYGYFSIIYDTEKMDNPPKSLEDLTKPEYKKSLILMDPRTSSPGLGFLLWTIAVYGEEYLKYWDRLQPSILTITDGWSSGYGLFTQGEAPMVLSYTTSPSYHVEYEDTDRYQALLFKNGNYMQIEGLGIIKNSSNIENAKKFVDYILSDEAQSVIPTTNWMFPVNESVELPKSFDYALKPETSLQLDYQEIEKKYNNWLSNWAENSVK